MTEWSKDLLSYRMNRADETMEDARILASAGRWNACVNRLYYSCFYAVTGLLVRHGFSSSKHTGVRSLFNLHYVKQEKYRKIWRRFTTIFSRDAKDKKETTSILSASKNRRSCRGYWRPKNSLNMSPCLLMRKERDLLAHVALRKK